MNTDHPKQVFMPVDYKEYRLFVRTQENVWIDQRSEKDADVVYLFKGKKPDKSKLVAFKKFFHNGERVHYLQKER